MVPMRSLPVPVGNHPRSSGVRFGWASPSAGERGESGHLPRSLPVAQGMALRHDVNGTRGRACGAVPSARGGGRPVILRRRPVSRCRGPAAVTPAVDGGRGRTTWRAPQGPERWTTSAPAPTRPRRRRPPPRPRSGHGRDVQLEGAGTELHLDVAAVGERGDIADSLSAACWRVRDSVRFTSTSDTAALHSRRDERPGRLKAARGLSVGSDGCSNSGFGRAPRCSWTPHLADAAPGPAVAAASTRRG